MKYQPTSYHQYVRLFNIITNHSYFDLRPLLLKRSISLLRRRGEKMKYWYPLPATAAALKSSSVKSWDMKMDDGWETDFLRLKKLILAWEWKENWAKERLGSVVPGDSPEGAPFCNGNIVQEHFRARTRSWGNILGQWCNLEQETFEPWCSHMGGPLYKGSLVQEHLRVWTLWHAISLVQEKSCARTIMCEDTLILVQQ